MDIGFLVDFKGKVNPALNLLPNTYGVSVEISAEGRATPLETRRFISMFTITSHDCEVGVVRLDHRWEPAAVSAKPQSSDPEHTT